jgi:peptide/nickel transport system substrate-binding protein
MNQDPPTHSRPRKRKPGRRPWQGLALLAVLAIAVLVIAGCGSSSTSNTSAGGASAAGGSTSASASSAGGALQGVTASTNDQSLGVAAPSGGTPKSGGTLTVAWEQEPPCIDGNAVWVQAGYLSQQYLEELVSAAPNGKSVPWLATSWKTSNGGKTYTFQIRRNVKFTDGTPLTAQAVATNFYDWLNAKNTATYNSYVAAYIGDVFQSAKALSTYTLQVNLKQPYVYFIDGLSQYAFGIQSPKQLSQPATVQCDHPVGTGAFEVQQWNHGQDVVLVRNPNWTSQPANERHKGLAYVDKVIWRFVADNTTRWSALQTGAAQLLYDVPAVDWAAAKSQFEVLRHTTGGTPFRFFLAAKWGPLKDVRLRQAVVYAFNDKAAVQAAYQGERIANENGSLSPANVTYDTTVNDALAYSPSKANSLLDQAGWTKRDSQGYRTKDGKELTLRLVYGTDENADQDDVQLFQILQAEEKQVGINVILVPVAPSQFWTSKQTVGPNWDIQPWYWVGRSAETFHVVWNPEISGAPNTFNATGYFDPRVTADISKLDQTTDVNQQTTISHDIQQLLTEKDSLVLGIAGMQVTLAVSPKLHGVWQSDDVGEPVLSDAWLSN